MDAESGELKAAGQRGLVSPRTDASFAFNRMRQRRSSESEGSIIEQRLTTQNQPLEPAQPFFPKEPFFLALKRCKCPSRYSKKRPS
jgi:hypothetical protein